MSSLPELTNLYRLLDEAVALSATFSGGYSNHFASAEEFHLALCESIAKLKSGDTTEINTLYFWFAPTCDWDDLIGKEGQDIANALFERLSELYNQRSN